MKRLQWETKSSLIRSGFILRGILAISLPFIATSLYTFYYYDWDITNRDAIYAVLLLGMLFILLAFMVIAVNTGRNAPGFIIDAEGIVNYHLTYQPRGSRMVNLLAVLGRLWNPRIGGRRSTQPECREKMKIRWQDIKKAKYYPKKRLISLNCGFGAKMYVFCTRKNYPEVEKTIKEMILINKPKYIENTLEEQNGKI